MTPPATPVSSPSPACAPGPDVAGSGSRGVPERLARGRVRPGLPTRRAAVLAVVVCALALALAVPLRTYLTQRQDLADTVTQQDALAAEVAGLQAELDQLRDPVHVQAQARQRLHYVMPGETPYQVQLPPEVERAAEEADQPRAPAPWYSELWSTVLVPGTR